MARAKKKPAEPAHTTEPAQEKPEKPTCGLVMPISALDGCSEQHWSEVRSIITDAIESAGFVANLVSDADDVGIIQKRIIQNLYENPIVVCDVSAKNSNVMFELGLRLAFDKPTIIVKDDKTAYSFDTAPIEHVPYPRDLRYSQIVDFKRSLAEKVKATFEKSQSDPNYTTFLKHFGRFTVAKLDKTEVSADKFVLEELRELRKTLERREIVEKRTVRVPNREQSGLEYAIDKAIVDSIASFAKTYPSVGDIPFAVLEDAALSRLRNVVHFSHDAEIGKDYLTRALRNALYQKGFSEFPSVGPMKPSEEL